MPRKKIKIVKNKSSYLQIGHDGYSRGDYDKKNPNYMWVFSKGRIYKEKETQECPGHGSVGEWCGLERDFSGRYDGTKRVISCVINTNSITSFRHLPQSVVSQLEQCFPNAKKIVVF